ncbi:MAG: NUDIX hydrolase, partial [Thermoplasmata archaeon]|nr:NUDIX hydrolase [Thermoplasmata archaeon]
PKESRAFGVAVQGGKVPGVTRVVNIAVISAGSILLIRRAPADSLPGYWEIPGGGVESGESFESASARELAEETGIRESALREIHHQRGPAPPGFHQPVLELALFLVDVLPRPEVRLDPKEHSEFAWIRPGELPARRMMALNRHLAELACSRAGATSGASR